MAVEVFFGLAAISSIFLRPQDTETNFAWPIQPDVMAAVLGSFYFASALIFVLPLFASSWQHVRVMILPARRSAPRCSWRRCCTGTSSRSAPSPSPSGSRATCCRRRSSSGCTCWHQRRSAPVGAGIEEPIVGWAGTFFRCNGLALTATALAGFVVPRMVIAVAPWTITPLTTRTLCGWLLAVGLLQLWMAWEGDWRRARLATTC